MTQQNTKDDPKIIWSERVIAIVLEDVVPTLIEMRRAGIAAKTAMAASVFPRRDDTKASDDEHHDVDDRDNDEDHDHDHDHDRAPARDIKVVASALTWTGPPEDRVPVKITIELNPSHEDLETPGVSQNDDAGETPWPLLQPGMVAVPKAMMEDLAILIEQALEVHSEARRVTAHTGAGLNRMLDIFKENGMDRSTLEIYARTNAPTSTEKN